MNKDDFLNQIKQRLKDKTREQAKQEHLDSIKYLNNYDEEKEIKKLNKELKRNIILNED